MSFAVSGSRASQLDALRLRFPFNPRFVATTVISAAAGRGDDFELPAVVSAPDLGQMLLTCPERSDARKQFDEARKAEGPPVEAPPDKYAFEMVARVLESADALLERL